MSLIAQILKDIQTDYPNIHYHLYSGNAEDVTERLDKGLLDFGLLIQPTDISKYDYIHIPAKNRWGVVMPKDSPLAQKDAIRKEDLLHIPLIISQQVLAPSQTENELEMCAARRTIKGNYG